MHSSRWHGVAAATILTMGAGACGSVGGRIAASVTHRPASFVAAAAPSNPAPSAAPDITETRTAALTPLADTPPATFTAVDFLDAREGWVGGDGAVGATSDGGQTWTWHAVAGLTPESLAFADSRDGWMAAATDACIQGMKEARQCATVLLHTADGGGTWTIQHTVACGGLCGPGKVQALDAVHAGALAGCTQGGVAGQPCTELLQTSDGGTHWAAVALPKGFAPSDMAWVTGGGGWVSGVRCPAGAAGPGICPAAVLHTDDGGRTWQAQTLPDALVGGPTLSFANAQDGWLIPSAAAFCTMGGCWLPLYATTDGGRTWAKVPSTYSRSGFQEHPVLVSPSVGFIPIGGGAGIGIGGVARTTDGGRTWASAGDAKDWSVQAVSAAGPDDLWAIGAQKIPPTGPAAGFLVHSTDGGQTWTQQLPALRPTTAVNFLDAGTGFGISTASDPGAVLATTDGGVHWTEVADESATGAQLRYLSFVDAKDGWAAGTTAGTAPWQGGRAVLLATRDGGRTWTAVAHPAGTVMGLHPWDATHGAMVTSAGPGGPTPAWWMTTADGGATWQPMATVPAGGQLMSVGVVDPHHAWALDLTRGPSPGFALISTADGGRSWTPLAQFPFGAQIALYPAGPQNAWIVQASDGANSGLLHTTDGGRTWTRQTMATLAITDIDFLGPDQGWLLTPAGLWRTRDGGRSWTQV